RELTLMSNRQPAAAFRVAALPARPPLPGNGRPMRDFALEVYFSRWQSTARHHLTASDSETLTLAELLAMADAEDRQRWETMQLGYTDPRAASWLREAIACGYQHVSAETILCFAGGQEGIHAAMHAL